MTQANEREQCFLSIETVQAYNLLTNDQVVGMVMKMCCKFFITDVFKSKNREDIPNRFKYILPFKVSMS